MKEVVHVPTLELVEKVLKVAKENGFKTPKYPVEYYFKVFGCKTCFRIEKNDFRAATKDFYENEGHKVITTEEFLNRYKPKFRPIAMKCNQEQFEAVRGKLMGCRIDNITSFDNCTYLVNNFRGDNLIISNLYGGGKIRHGRQVFEEWNEKTFLEYCGIEVSDEVDELDQLRKENEELKQQLKAIEGAPKVGDVCLYWENGSNMYLLGMFSKNIKRLYDNCIKATDENIQAKIKELHND